MSAMKSVVAVPCLEKRLEALENCAAEREKSKNDFKARGFSTLLEALEAETARLEEGGEGAWGVVVGVGGCTSFNNYSAAPTLTHTLWEGDHHFIPLMLEAILFAQKHGLVVEERFDGVSVPIVGALRFSLPEFGRECYAWWELTYAVEEAGDGRVSPVLEDYETLAEYKEAQRKSYILTEEALRERLQNHWDAHCKGYEA